MQIPKIIHPLSVLVSPMHTWPALLKRAIWMLVVVVCLGACMLLLGGLLGTGIILLELALN